MVCLFHLANPGGLLAPPQSLFFFCMIIDFGDTILFSKSYVVYASYQNDHESWNDVHAYIIYVSTGIYVSDTQHNKPPLNNMKTEASLILVKALNMVKMKMVRILRRTLHFTFDNSRLQPVENLKYYLTKMQQIRNLYSKFPFA